MDWMLDPPEEEEIEWGELPTDYDSELEDSPDFYLYELADNAASGWQNSRGL